MTRLIDADALIKDVDGDLTDSIAEGIAIEKIMNAPTVDAVPVIRCKDCKHWNTSPIDSTANICYWGNYRKDPEDYCSWAERKEHDTVD